MAARWFDHALDEVWVKGTDRPVNVAPLDPFPRRSICGLLWRMFHWRRP